MFPNQFPTTTISRVNSHTRHFHLGVLLWPLPGAGRITYYSHNAPFKIKSEGFSTLSVLIIFLYFLYYIYIIIIKINIYDYIYCFGLALRYMQTKKLTILGHHPIHIALNNFGALFLRRSVDRMNSGTHFFLAFHIMVSYYGQVHAIVEAGKYLVPCRPPGDLKALRWRKRVGEINFCSQKWKCLPVFASLSV